MSLIATENKRYSEVVKYELAPEQAYCREVVVANDSAQSYVVGTVLGVVTATGKYKVSVQSADDGSQVPAAVVVRDVTVPATTDTKVLALVRGPAIVAKGTLAYDSSFNTDAEIAFVFSSLAAKGILANTSV